MSDRIRVEVWGRDGTRTEEIRPARDREWCCDLPFESDAVAVTRVTDLDD